MEPKSILLATALALGAMAQTEAVIGLFLNNGERHNATLVASVVSAVPEATTYLLRRLADPNCTDEESSLKQCDQVGTPSTVTSLLVNGPSTFARHYTEPGLATHTECSISGVYYGCDVTIASSPRGYTRIWNGGTLARAGSQTGTDPMAGVIRVGDTSSLLHQVTITAGLEKILAVMTTTSSTSSQTAASASSGPSVTGDSASATSSSSSASPSSTTESGAETAAFRNVSLAAFCGLIALALRL